MHRNSLRIPRILVFGLALACSALPSAGQAAPDPHASYSPSAPRAAQVVSARAAGRLALEGRSALWVFFTDKSETDQRSFAAAVREAGSRVADRARARRVREGEGLFVADYYDVPVAARYVDGVGSTGATIRQVSRWLNAVSVEADRATADRIAALPFVRVIEPIAYSKRVESYRSVTPLLPVELPGQEPKASVSPRAESSPFLAPTLDPPGGYGTSLAQLNGINAKAAQDSGYTGAGVIVAMFDTGFDKTHFATKDLKRLAEYDFVFHDAETSNQAGDLSYAWGHGTGTWAVLGGHFIYNLIGPAYNATFLLAKTEDVRSETPIEEDNWLAAVEWADSLGVDVISSSLAYMTFDSPSDNLKFSDLDGRTALVTNAAVLAHRRGIIVANAMANTGPFDSTLNAPADADSILSVGAVDSGNLIAAFSSRGPTSDGRGKPEIVAQGVNTTWATAGTEVGLALTNGTSLATPLIGGAAAQVREAHPEWTVSQVRYALKITADKHLTPDSTTYGWGRPDVVKAIYTSPLGGPVFPKPFDLLLPVNNRLVPALPNTVFKWRATRDPNGDPVTYQLTLNKVKLPADSLVYTVTTTDTTATYPGTLGLNDVYEWFVAAKDPANHARECRSRFRFPSRIVTAVEDAGAPSAPQAVLYQNRPNPVQGTAQIPFMVGSGAGSGVASVTLRIFDSSGRLVRTLAQNETRTASVMSVKVWDGTDEKGHRVGSGIYYYRLTVAGKNYSRRMVVIR